MLSAESGRSTLYCDPQYKVFDMHPHATRSCLPAYSNRKSPWWKLFRRTPEPILFNLSIQYLVYVINIAQSYILILYHHPGYSPATAQNTKKPSCDQPKNARSNDGQVVLSRTGRQKRPSWDPSPATELVTCRKNKGRQPLQRPSSRKNGDCKTSIYCNCKTVHGKLMKIDENRTVFVSPLKQKKRPRRTAADHKAALSGWSARSTRTPAHTSLECLFSF